MGCTTGISADLINDCDTQTPVAGLEVKAWALNRTDISTITYDGSNGNEVSAITMLSTKQAWVLQGFKKSQNAGHDIVVAEDIPSRYKQFFSFKPWGVDADVVEDLDDLEDLVIIVENKNKGISGDGAFEIYGLETGLYKSADTRRSNDNNAIQSIEMTTQDGEDSTVSRHVFFDTDYATSLAALVALETPAV